MTMEILKTQGTYSDSLKIGIMGGTFDPIHYGHLVTAEAARVEFGLDKVVFVPSGLPPHKKSRNLAGKGHRYKMTLLATKSNKYFSVSSEEIDRQGYSYTIDTIKSFDEKYRRKAKFFFITGADAISEILTWKDVDSLFKICEFVAATRPGFNQNDLFSDIEYLREKYNSKIHFIEVPSLAISSSDIRKRVENGLSIKYLLPESVEEYIYENRLYIGRLEL